MYHLRPKRFIAPCLHKVILSEPSVVSSRQYHPVTVTCHFVLSIIYVSVASSCDTKLSKAYHLFCWLLWINQARLLARTCMCKTTFHSCESSCTFYLTVYKVSLLHWQHFKDVHTYLKTTFFLESLRNLERNFLSGIFFFRNILLGNG